MRTVFQNGVIYHGRYSSGFKTCSTMVINGQHVEYLGNDAVRRIPQLDDAKIIDLQGRSVFASFVDGHMHLLQFGASLQKVALDGCRNLEDIRKTIAKAAKLDRHAPRILCRGWRQATTGRSAFASMIDDIDPRPIYIDADDLHSEWCSSSALAEMGITRDTPDPVDGVIHRDMEGNPNGLLSEGAVITLVWPFLIGLMSRKEKMRCVRSATKEYHASGYTSVIEMAMDQGMWELLEEMQAQGPLGIRIAAHWIISPTGDTADDLAQVQTAIEMHGKYNLDTSPDFRIAGIKVICDGVVDSCTAALSKPYLVSPGGLGDPNWKPDALRAVVAEADAAGLQVAMHAIGDAAIHLAINTLESLGTTGRRHRIEHLELTHPDDAKRLGKLGITASMQPVHSDPSILGAWPELIGQERCDWAFPHRDIHEHGAQLAFGTDSPTAPHLPLPNLYVANTRTSAREPHNHSKINSRKGMDMHDVFNAATWGAAYSCFAEKEIGSLEVGKKADFIILEGVDDKVSADALLKANVRETWMNGVKVFP
jgi:predicted amidohydrolase YtcJ